MRKGYKAHNIDVYKLEAIKKKYKIKIKKEKTEI